MINRTILNKTRYLRTVLSILPFGILTVIVGMKYYQKLPYPEDLKKLNSIVVKYEIKEVRYNETKTRHNTLFIYLRNYAQPIYTYKINYVNKILSIDPQLKSMEFWIDSDRRILQAKLDETLLFEYNRTNYLMLGLIIFGFICIVASLVYIGSHPEDLFGGDKEKSS